MSNSPSRVVDEKLEDVSITSGKSDKILPTLRTAEVYDVAAVDPVLAKKIAAVNDAIDEIGLTPYHWKLFCLNGFGYAVDSVRLFHFVSAEYKSPIYSLCLATTTCVTRSGLNQCVRSRC